MKVDIVDGFDDDSEKRLTNCISLGYPFDMMRMTRPYRRKVQPIVEGRLAQWNLEKTRAHGNQYPIQSSRDQFYHRAEFYRVFEHLCEYHSDY